MLKKPATIAVVLGAILFSLIYFGLDTKPKKQRALEKSRAVNLEATGIQNIMAAAKDSLSDNERSYLEALNIEAKAAATDSSKVPALRKLSAAWYDAGHPIVAGYYAEEIAKFDQGHEAWSVAGTTYILGMRSARQESQRQFAKSRAVRAIESAISIEPNNVADQINLALIYVEAPDTNPMQGILMLRELNEKFPEDVSIMNQLARLAIQTNQTGKALERLTTAYAIDPENRNTICLLATAHKMNGDEKNAEVYKVKCENIINKQ